MTERERFDAAMKDEAFREKFFQTLESIDPKQEGNRVDVITQALQKLGFKVTREEVEAGEREAGMI